MKDRVDIHRIEAENCRRGLGVSRKLTGRQAFLLPLEELGRQAADAWLGVDFDAIGRRSTIDLKEKFPWRSTTQDRASI